MKKTIPLTGKKPTAGFTIVELMIALSVLSVLLLVCTLTLLNLGKMYSKGTNKADAQNSARNTINDISNQLQLGGANPIYNTSADYGSICIGTTRYSYVIGRQVVSGTPDTTMGQTRHALWRDTMKGSSDCPEVSITDMNQANPTVSSGLNSAGDGVELVPENMRLTAFSAPPVKSSAGLYDIEVGIAYGANDLLCVREASLPGGSDCDPGLISQHANSHLHNLEDPTAGSTYGCVTGAGDQFCSVSNLSMTVARRLPSE